MKRFIQVFVFICLMVMAAGTAWAEPVDAWNVTFSGKFTDILMSDGGSLPDGTTISWDGGTKSIDMYVTPDTKLTNSYDYYYGYGCGSMDRDAFAEKPVSAVELKSANATFDIALNPEGSSENFNLTMNVSFYYYNLYDSYLDSYAGYVFMSYDHGAFDSRQIVYDGTVYEFTLGWTEMYDYWVHPHQIDPTEDAALRAYFGWADNDVWYAYKINSNPIHFFGQALGPQAVPAPAALWLLGSGLAGLAALKRRQCL